MKTLVSVVALLAVGMALATAGASAQPRKGERLYPGAPPTVPHEVEDRKAICQDCHATGDGGAPLAPHPTRANYCVACHVAQEDAAKPFPAAR